MKKKFKTPEELAHYFKFVPNSKADEERLAKAWEMYTTNYRGDGCMGCCAEMLTATSHSKKNTVSNAGRTDCFIKHRTAAGVVIPVAVERKTNGGRIETIETDFSKAERVLGKYVVYSLDVCNSGTGNVRR